MERIEVVSRELSRDFLVEDFADGERDDDAVLLAEETVNFVEGITGVSEGYEEAFLAFGAAHGGFKGVYVRPAGLVFLLHLHGIKALMQRQFVRRRFAGAFEGGDGEDSSVNSLVADLDFVLSAAEGDHRPILKFKGRNGAELFFAPRQVTDDEAATDGPKAFVLAQPADSLVFQALGHDAAGGGGNINANPLPFQFLRRDQRRAATAEGIKDNVVFVAAGFDDAFE